MMVMETLFDVISASTGAVLGALFAFFLNRKRRNQMTNQLVVSKQALEKIKLENQQLLEQIHEKEDLILQMQMQILGKEPKRKKKNP